MQESFFVSPSCTRQLSQDLIGSVVFPLPPTAIVAWPPEAPPQKFNSGAKILPVDMSRERPGESSDNDGGGTNILESLVECEDSEAKSSEKGIRTVESVAGKMYKL